MKEYRVTLHVQQDADTPQEAAEEALGVILRSGDLTFEVECPDGGLYEVAVTGPLAQLVASCKQVRWESDGVGELLGDFVNGLGIDMSVPGPPKITRFGFDMNVPEMTRVPGQ
jgi:hypothetical protein